MTPPSARDPGLHECREGCWAAMSICHFSSWLWMGCDQFLQISASLVLLSWLTWLLNFEPLEGPSLLDLRFSKYFIKTRGIKSRRAQIARFWVVIWSLCCCGLQQNLKKLPTLCIQTTTTTWTLKEPISLPTMTEP